MRREAVQFRAIRFKPVFGGGGMGAVLQDQAPEFWSVVHVAAMGHFMGGD